MAHTYSVRGGQGPAIPGALGPDELDGRSEWVPVPARASLLEAIRARLGSEIDLRKVVLAVLCPLRPALAGPPLEALLRLLPFPLAREVQEGERNLNARLPPPAGAGDYLVDVARMLQQPPRRAALTVKAVLASARAALAREDAERVASRLPPGLADLWAPAR